MARLADAFVQGAADEGHRFTYELECVGRLDPLVDLFLQSRPSPEVVDSMAMSMGAFVGELILRFGGGRWTYVPEAGSPAVQTGSRYVCFPLNKVGKRLTVGPEHSIAQFVEVAISGDMPPEARQVRPPSSAG
jgi:hypothetical protein